MSNLRPLSRSHQSSTNHQEKPKGQVELLTYLLVYGALTIVVMASTHWLRSLPIALLSQLTIALVAIVVAHVVWSFSRGFWSVPGAYFVVFALFHFGSVLAVSLGVLGGDLEYYIAVWYYRPTTKYAIILALLGLVACVAGVFAGQLLPSPKQHRSQVADGLEEDTTAAVGLVGMIVAIAGWTWLLISKGSTLIFTSSYYDYLLIAEGNAFLGLSYTLLGCGLVFLVATRPSLTRVLGFALFGLFALIALPLGLRGEVLFPMVAALVVLSRERMILNQRTSIVLIIVGLALIGLLREVREVGLAYADQYSFKANPLAGVAELGSALRPVSEVVLWHDLGEDFLYGASYWAPFDRQLVYIVPGWRRLPAYLDERLLNVWIINRVGFIGFSPVAEAYKNFGMVGVVLVMFLTGVLLGSMENWPATTRSRIVLGGLLLSMLVEVRNDFGQVPAQLLVLVLLLLMVRLMYAIARLFDISELTPIGIREARRQSPGSTRIRK